MRLSSRERLALRVVVDLGRRYGDGPVSLHAVSKDSDLPRAYLARIAVQLRRAGVLESVRGAQGGYLLARQPELISVGDVIRAVEGVLLNVDCSHADPGCCQDPHCATKSVFLMLASSISNALDHLTIADVLDEEMIPVTATSHVNRETLSC